MVVRPPYWLPSNWLLCLSSLLRPFRSFGLPCFISKTSLFFCQMSLDPGSIFVSFWPFSCYLVPKHLTDHLPFSSRPSPSLLYFPEVLPVLMYGTGFLLVSTLVPLVPHFLSFYHFTESLSLPDFFRSHSLTAVHTFHLLIDHEIVSV